MKKVGKFFYEGRGFEAGVVLRMYGLSSRFSDFDEGPTTGLNPKMYGKIREIFG